MSNLESDGSIMDGDQFIEGATLIRFRANGEEREPGEIVVRMRRKAS